MAQTPVFQFRLSEREHHGGVLPHLQTRVRGTVHVATRYPNGGKRVSVSVLMPGPLKKDGAPQYAWTGVGEGFQYPLALFVCGPAKLHHPVPLGEKLPPPCQLCIQLQNPFPVRWLPVRQIHLIL